MGYYSRLDGYFLIDPPLKYGEFKDTDWVHGLNSRRRCICLSIVDFEEATDDGILITKTASSVVPISEDEIKAYTLEKDIEELLEEFPYHDFTGTIRVEGEESGDIWRIVAKGRDAVVEKAVLMWPDGTMEEGR